MPYSSLPKHRRTLPHSKMKSITGKVCFGKGHCKVSLHQVERFFPVQKSNWQSQASIWYWLSRFRKVGLEIPNTFAVDETFPPHLAKAMRIYSLSTASSVRSSVVSGSSVDDPTRAASTASARRTVPLDSSTAFISTFLSSLTLPGHE